MLWNKYHTTFYLGYFIQFGYLKIRAYPNQYIITSACIRLLLGNS